MSVPASVSQATVTQQTSSIEIRDEDVNLLTIILDTNPLEWGRRQLLQQQHSGAAGQQQRQLITLQKCISQLLVFINAFLLSHYNNRIVVIAAHSGKSQFLFPIPQYDTVKQEDSQAVANGSSSSTALKNASFATNDFDSIRQVLIQQLKTLMSSSSSQTDSDGDTQMSDASAAPQQQSQQQSKKSGVSLAGALSTALCHMNRLELEKPLSTEMHKRILVMSVSKDVPTQYISVMNAIFCAQKMKVTIDACNLAAQDESSFLQQASHITGGVYLRPKQQEGLLEYLLNVFAVDVPMRAIVQLPVQQVVDFKATCFETKKTIDRGFVCSVCLSIFSKYLPVCTTCGSKTQLVTAGASSAGTPSGTAVGAGVAPMRRAMPPGALPARPLAPSAPK